MNKPPYFLVLILIAILYSCSVRFESDERLLTKGKIIDSNSSPIVGAEISVYSRRPTSLISENEFLLGQNFSNTEGDFQVISLSDRSDEFSVEIENGNEFTRYLYLSNLEENPPQDLLINLETKTLKQIGRLNYNITRTSGSNSDLVFSFSYESTSCVEFYDETGLVADQSSCYEQLDFNSTLDNDNPDATNSFFTTFDSLIEFRYSINGQPEESQTLIIDQLENEFNFSY
jgi:hypothetical protein